MSVNAVMASGLAAVALLAFSLTLQIMDLVGRPSRGSALVSFLFVAVSATLAVNLFIDNLSDLQNHSATLDAVMSGVGVSVITVFALIFVSSLVLLWANDDRFHSVACLVCSFIALALVVGYLVLILVHRMAKSGW